MAESPVIVWDLKTVPDLEAAARMLGIDGQSDEQVRSALGSGFAELSRFMGGKPDGIDGGKVEEMVADEKIAEVAHYCDADVVNAHSLWLIYDVFGSVLSPEELLRSALRLQSCASTRSRTPTCWRP